MIARLARRLLGTRKSLQVSRFEVIDHRPSGDGRALTIYGVSDVRFALQDNEQTLKVFLT